jgi:pimeloyl-ACP methyl ester carboxylesterase
LALGGEREFISSSSGNQVDTLFLSQTAFEKVLKEGGAQRVELQAGQQWIPAVQLEANSPLHQTLLRAPFAESGWKFHQTLDGQVYLLAASSYEAACEQWKEVAYFTDENSRPVAEKTRGPVPTVVLNGGLGASYESRSLLAEASAWLLQGVDVQLYNLPGFGQSSGFLSQESAESTLKAVCEHTKQKRGLSNEQLIVTGTCFGAKLAAAYASSNEGKGAALVLVDAYADSQEMAQAVNEKQSFAAARNFISHHFFDHHRLDENLKAVRGHVAVISSYGDEFIHEHGILDKNIDQLPADGRQVYKSIVLSGIKHAKGWYLPIDETQYPTFADGTPKKESRQSDSYLGHEMIQDFLARSGLCQKGFFQ